MEKGNVDNNGNSNDDPDERTKFILEAIETSKITLKEDIESSANKIINAITGVIKASAIETRSELRADIESSVNKILHTSN